MELTENNIGKIIVKYLSGKSTDSEEEYIYDWLKKDASNRQLFEEIRAGWNPFENENLQVDEAWRKINKRLFEKKLSINRQPSFSTNTRNLSFLRRIAAIFLLVIGIGGAASYFLYNSQEPEISYNIYKTSFGEKTSITLSDGTQIHLNSGTTLKVPSSFARKSRSVYLDGEAFLDVTHDDSSPFIVQTLGVNIEVLGTEFNVSAYSDEEKVITTLHQGRVAMSGSENNASFKRAILEPGDKVVYNKKQQKITKQKVDLRYSATWMDNHMFFDNNSLEEIAKRLERKFNVSVSIEGETLKKVMYTGNFDQNENIGDILKLLNEISPIKFQLEIKKDGKEIIISPQLEDE